MTFFIYFSMWKLFAVTSLIQNESKTAAYELT